MKKRLKSTTNKQACLIFLLGVLSLFTACQRHSEMQTEGVSFLQGVWTQDSVPQQDQMLSFALHEFTFTCDSVYTKMYVTSKTKTMPDSCFNNGSWTEYAKGVYVLRGDSIIVEGIYTKENGKQKISGCYKSGQYLPRFKLVYHNQDSVVLENRFDSRPIILRKIKDITCVPKKRWEM